MILYVTCALMSCGCGFRVFLPIHVVLLNFFVICFGKFGTIYIVWCWNMIGSRVVKSLWERDGCAVCLFSSVAFNGFIYWCGHCVTPRWSHGCLIFFLLWNWRGCGPVLIFLRDLAYPLAQGWWCVFTCYVGDQSTWENPSVCLLQG